MYIKKPIRDDMKIRQISFPRWGIGVTWIDRRPLGVKFRDGMSVGKLHGWAL